MEEVNVEIVRREVIKPTSPSPQDHLQLSIFDLRFLGVYFPTIFFYKAKDLPPEIISRNLKSSLSETLSRFYPLAGRVKGVSINCNNEGVVFTEARTDLLLHDFLRNINSDSLKRFYPTMVPGDSTAEWPLLSVKVTFSHMICDASSLLTFVMDWANTTAKRETNDTILFAETTIYPPPPTPSPSLYDSLQQVKTGKCVTNRFVFHSSKIAELKLKAASKSVPVPSRVEAISALIWRCAANAASRSNWEVPRSTLMGQALDLRLRIIPSTVLTRDVFGNLQTGIFLKNGAESELNIFETVALFRKAKEETNKMIQENLQGNTLGEYLMSVLGRFPSDLKPEIDLYTMTSWCRKPFYEVDFGWGSPVWITSTPRNENRVLLFDSKDGESVEAWVALPDQDMYVFLHDQELLAYAVLNPPVMI